MTPDKPGSVERQGDEGATNNVKMVTGEEVDEIERQMRSKVTGPWFDLMRTLLKERDAALELAFEKDYRRGISIEIPSGMTPRQAQKEVDEQIRRDILKSVLLRLSEGGERDR
jgi:hypothetical protein